MQFRVFPYMDELFPKSTFLILAQVLDMVDIAISFLEQSLEYYLLVSVRPLYGAIQNPVLRLVDCLLDEFLGYLYSQLMCILKVFLNKLSATVSADLARRRLQC